MLPLRKPIRELVFREKLRGAFICLTFLGLYFYVTYVRFDWTYGAKTLAFYIKGREGLNGLDASEVPYCDEDTGKDLLTNKSCVSSYADVETIEDLTAFVHRRLINTALAMEEVCHRCDIGITLKKDLVQDISLRDYICVDFEAPPHTYRSRETCEEDDAAWAANPDPSTDRPPCCSNATLVLASFVTHAREQDPYRTVDDDIKLVELTEDEAVDTLDRFVRRNIHTDQFFAQVVISRAGRMAGINYGASWQDMGCDLDSIDDIGSIERDGLSSCWAPDLVLPKKQYWTFRHDDVCGLDTTWSQVMVGVLALLLAADVRHTHTHPPSLAATA